MSHIYKKTLLTAFLSIVFLPFVAFAYDIDPKTVENENITFSFSGFGSYCDPDCYAYNLFNPSGDHVTASIGYENGENWVNTMETPFYVGEWHLLLWDEFDHDATGLTYSEALLDSAYLDQDITLYLGVLNNDSFANSVLASIFTSVNDVTGEIMPQLALLFVLLAVLFFLYAKVRGILR